MVEPFRKVLVPLDGSDRAEVALTWALSIVQRMGGELVLVRVVSAAKERDDGERYLSGAAKTIGTTRTLIRTRVEEGDPAEMILKSSKEEGASCVAMATHGRSGLVRWFLGSVTEKVIRAGDRPVVVVPARNPQADAARILVPVRKILVPTDGSGHSLVVLPWAKEIARSFGSELVLLHVSPASILVPPHATLAGPYVVPGVPPAVPTPSEPVARKIAEQHSDDGVRMTPVDEPGDPASEIVDRAKALNVDLVALSTHGRTGSARWMLGSVAEKVVRALDVPALVVRPSGLSPAVAPPP